MSFVAGSCESGASIEDSIVTLSKKPELAWMAQLRTRNDVEWNAVKAKLENWDDEAGH